MIFLTYWFVAFAAVFFFLYWLIQAPSFRTWLLLGACLVFHYHFAGPAGVAPIILLGTLTYICGRIGGPVATTIGIAASALGLLTYKYLIFLAELGIGLALPDLGQRAATEIRDWLPLAPPLAISFFVFEFVHYLIEVRRGQPAIRSPISFTLFAVFWPSLVAGPIKRYRQFLPALERGLTIATSGDVVTGALRVAVGLCKKFVADYLTQVITFWQDYFEIMSLGSRWLLLAAIALRILFDFSGYSDMAIGFGRMMGIRLPENFRWPYLATSPIDFWHRWHISLSTWIRDYIYIPLGGGRHGIVRKGINGMTAFALCGLWHGAGWNFALWGIYHGIGVVVSTAIERALGRWHFAEAHVAIRGVATVAGWAATLLFVMFGWLLFFYPVSRAIDMARMLLWL